MSPKKGHPHNPGRWVYSLPHCLIFGHTSWFTSPIARVSYMFSVDTVALWMGQRNPINHQKDGWNPKNNGTNHLPTGAGFRWPIHSISIFHGGSKSCKPASLGGPPTEQEAQARIDHLREWMVSWGLPANQQYIIIYYIWRFPKMEVPQNGWFILDNPWQSY